ncbi:unnamed protein product [Fusarium venenatum]|uniref:Xylanolytic transcriptional activator regulatory domain-containing protein n=1 Tax=Fusarium venenatum TaxID=56646 RepID=A0A2L2TAK2_9HYPO|nr:uncharacterized protein FVRRES_04372 [Fusarium venenatum]CEI59936.1 unnamed protein product [Fusarium venenatum]
MASDPPAYRVTEAATSVNTRARRATGIESSKRVSPSKRYVEALQERIKILESQIHRLKDNSGSYEEVDAAILEEGQSQSEAESSSEDANHSHRSPIKDISDRLGNLNIGEDGHIRYFGSRINFSLLKNSPAASATISSHDLQKQAARTLELLDLNFKVSDELRDHLLGIFWIWQNSWQYIVVKDLFLEDIYISHSGLYASPLLLSSVLALAARYSDRVELRTDPQDPNTAGNALAEKARMILFYESQAPKITTIQAAALLSLRETAVDKEALGWIYCGKLALVLLLEYP